VAPKLSTTSSPVRALKPAANCSATAVKFAATAALTVAASAAPAVHAATSAANPIT
jgi:hypothetical protein